MAILSTNGNIYFLSLAYFLSDLGDFELLIKYIMTITHLCNITKIFKKKKSHLCNSYFSHVKRVNPFNSNTIKYAPKKIKFIKISNVNTYAGWPGLFLFFILIL